MPFDRQKCKISLISYSMFIPLKLYFGYTMYTVSTYEKMVFFQTLNNVKINNFQSNSEWKMENITYSNQVYSPLFPMVDF